MSIDESATSESAIARSLAILSARFKNSHHHPDGISPANGAGEVGREVFLPAVKDDKYTHAPSPCVCGTKAGNNTSCGRLNAICKWPDH